MRCRASFHHRQAALVRKRYISEVSGGWLAAVAGPWELAELRQERSLFCLAAAAVTSDVAHRRGPSSRKRLQEAHSVILTDVVINGAWKGRLQNPGIAPFH